MLSNIPICWIRLFIASTDAVSILIPNQFYIRELLYCENKNHVIPSDIKINVGNDRLGIKAEFGSRVAIRWCPILCFVWNVFTTTAKCIYVIKWGHWNEKSRKIRLGRLITYKGQLWPFYGQKGIIICYYNHP